MTAAVAQAGNPTWATEILAWWAVQRATGPDEAAAAATLLPDTPRGRAGRVWAAVLSGDVDPADCPNGSVRLASSLLDGLTHKEIGAKLYISPKTVEQHVARIRQKLSAANRAELIAALRAALVRQ